MRFILLFLAVLALGFYAPVPRAQAATTPTMKLCPDGTVVGYTAKCPTSGAVRKICPSGAVVAYSLPCPLAVSPLVFGKNAVAVKACQSALHSPDSTKVGSTYTVAGFYGYSVLEMIGMQPPGEPHGGVVLNDATHQGDGAFGIFVPVDCAVGAP
jgi:hypothetical protein